MGQIRRFIEFAHFEQRARCLFANAIVGLGLRGGCKIDDGKVEFDHAGGYAGSVASEQPSNSNDSGSNGLRPHPV